MNKGKGMRAGVVLLSVMLLIQGCTPVQHVFREGPAVQSAKQAATGEGQTLHLLTSYTFEEAGFEPFEKSHNVKMQREGTSSGSVDEILDALDSSNPPDLIEFEYDRMKGLINFDTFEDLSQPPYNAVAAANRYFPGLSLERFSSLGSAELVFMPRSLHAGVTFYRADVLKENGFPSDPEKLGIYMESAERWLQMVRVLAKKGKRAMQQPTDPFEIYGLANGFFRSNGSFVRNTSEYIDALRIARASYQEQLPLGASIWDTAGQEALRQGELVMFVSGEWAKDQLSEWTPDLMDKWQVTRLPFNQYGVLSGWVYAIPKQSKNKEAAWAYIQYQLENEQRYRSSLYMSQWYGKLQPVYTTPLDTLASAIWEKEIGWRYTTLMAPERVIETIESAIRSELSDQLGLIAPYNANYFHSGDQ
ncbi:ABC transporter substrate-binding protein [Paenibacillus sp. MMS18-CY102]|uniref:ABC transporter substrate-binding protein n=1 Tax=Paenibacillus sp. MMS18-CY102 TaxID=2682849 RepID=UPI001365746E|nr:extracellular solute-binding protein [Paenibacillus sp. MMS18-CY102]MWC27847.1 extracellular solute-binding protein [Paenibacillus sp. MMS18-CY102]